MRATETQQKSKKVKSRRLFSISFLDFSTCGTAVLCSARHFQINLFNLNVFRPPNAQINQTRTITKLKMFNLFFTWFVCRFDCFSFASVQLSRGGGVFPSNKRIRAKPTTCARTVSFGSFMWASADCGAVCHWYRITFSWHMYAMGTASSIWCASGRPPPGARFRCDFAPNQTTLRRWIRRLNDWRLTIEQCTRYAILRRCQFTIKCLRRLRYSRSITRCDDWRVFPLIAKWTGNCQSGRTTFYDNCKSLCVDTTRTLSAEPAKSGCSCVYGFLLRVDWKTSSVRWR